MLKFFLFISLIDVDLGGGLVGVRILLLVQNLTLLLDLLRRCTYCYKRKRIGIRRQTKMFRFTNAKWTLRVALRRGMINLYVLRLYSDRWEQGQIAVSNLFGRHPQNR